MKPTDMVLIVVALGVLVFQRQIREAIGGAPAAAPPIGGPGQPRAGHEAFIESADGIAKRLVESLAGGAKTGKTSGTGGLLSSLL